MFECPSRYMNIFGKIMFFLFLSFTLTGFPLQAQSEDCSQVIKPNSSEMIYGATLVKKVFPGIFVAGKNATGHSASTIISTYSISADSNSFNSNLLLSLPDREGIDSMLFVIPLEMLEINNVELDGTDLVVKGTRYADTSDGGPIDKEVAERIKIRQNSEILEFFEEIHY